MLKYGIDRSIYGTNTFKVALTWFIALRCRELVTGRADYVSVETDSLAQHANEVKILLLEHAIKTQTC